MRSLPRLRFAHLPTAIEYLPRLSETLDGPRLWVKRDDQTGLAMGGNKSRKLEFLLAEAKANGARTLISTGAIQSNHCRQTAAAAARYGFDCTLVLISTEMISKVPKPTTMDEPHSVKQLKSPELITGNLLLDHLMGAEFVWVTNDQRDQVLQQTFNKAWKDGRKPYLIPYGGSNATGAAAFVYAMQEMLDQCKQSIGETSPPDWIVFPSSSGGTQAGLLLGERLFGYDGQILGISIEKPSTVLKGRVAALATSTAENLGVSAIFSPEDVLVNADYLGDGYGVMGEPEREAVYLFARTEGLLLDPVYTGRAAAGMIDLIRKGYFQREQTILFWHTGGTPALFADQYQDLV